MPTFQNLQGVSPEVLEIGHWLDTPHPRDKLKVTRQWGRMERPNQLQVLAPWTIRTKLYQTPTKAFHD